MADEKAFLQAAPPYTEKPDSGSTPLATRISHEYDTLHNSPNTSRSPRECYLYKGNGLTSKARLATSDGKEYRLIADIHKKEPSVIQLQEGKGTATSSLGTLTFPATHNDFQITTPQMSSQMVQVKAKIGHPHPTAYEFKIPAAASPHPRTVVWKRFGDNTTTSGYHLHDDFTHEFLATWTIVSGAKHQCVLRWHVEPSSVLEEVLIMLSFMGVLSRLKLRGKDLSGLPDGMARWNGMWFMAILGTGAMG